MAPSLLVIGVGSSLSFSQLFDILLAGVPMKEIGSNNWPRQLGVTVLGTVFLPLAPHTFP